MRLRNLAGFSLCAFLCAAQPPAASQTGGYTISGIVVFHGSGHPVKRARVIITMNEHRERTVSLFTAEDGRFTFTDVPPAKYTLQAEVHGEQRMYQQDDDQFSTGIVTGPGLDSEHLVFEFPAATSLAVDVTDEENEPARSATVTLFRKRITSGWAQMQEAQAVGTDNEGVAHFAHLTPGTYYIAVNGRPWYAQNMPVEQRPGISPDDAAKLNVAYPLTYYGGTHDPNAATPLQIAEGEKAHAQITLRAVPAAKLTIEGISGNPDQARGQITTALSAVGPGGIRIGIDSQTYDANNQLEISGFAPGNYMVSTSGFGPQGGRLQPLGAARVTAGEDLRLSAAQLSSTTVAGQITVEGGDPAGLMILLIAPVNNQIATCRVRQKGLFQCMGQSNPAIMPGWYEVRVNGSEFYPKSISVTGGSYRSGLLEVREGASVALSITAARGLTQLNGIVMDDARPLSGAMVLLVPDDMDVTRGIPRDQSDSDGTFTLPNVQPGRYFLVAIDHGHDLEYHNRQVLAPYLAHAAQLEIPLARGLDSVRVNVQKR